MKKYTSDEIKVLELKLCDCLYSWNRRMFFLVGLESQSKIEIKAVEAYKFLFRYYVDKFLHEISELYTFFDDRKDETILGQFIASKDERKKLQNYRNTIAHVDGDVNKTLKRLEDYSSAGNTTNQTKDLFLMIKHLRKAAAVVNLEVRVLEHLK